MTARKSRSAPKKRAEAFAAEMARFTEGAAEQVEAIHAANLQRDDAYQGRAMWVELERIVDSPRQTRKVSSPADDASLADDIAHHGLTHLPLLRARPGRTGEFEIVAGHRRVAALRLLAASGRGGQVIRRSGADACTVSIPAVVDDLDDLAAHAKTLNENFHRRDLSAWEQSQAVLAHETVMKAAGRKSDGRSVAEDLAMSYATLAPYLKVAHAITRSVCKGASACDASGEPDHTRLARLSLEALRRVAQEEGEQDRSTALARALARVAKRVHAELSSDTKARILPPAGEDGLQVNIRRPLGSLTGAQATRYLRQLVPAVDSLVRRAAPNLSDDEVREFVEALQELVSLLAAGRVARDP